jgi:putative membrane protein
MIVRMTTEQTTAASTPANILHGQLRAPTGDEQRTYLAGERTLLAWIRTSLALMGFGFLVAKFGLFLREVVAIRSAQGPGGPPIVQHPGLSLWLGIALVLLGLGVNVVAANEHYKFLRQFAGTTLAARRRYVAQIGMLVILVVLGAVMAVYLVLVGK